MSLALENRTALQPLLFPRSVALIGVAIGLTLQARQLRASRVETARSLNVELIKFAIDNPQVATAIESDLDPAESPKAAYLNLYFTFLSTGYSLKTISAESVSYQIDRIFAADYSRTWWTFARDSYMIKGLTRRERAFAELVDAAYQKAMRNLQPPGDGTTGG